MNTRTAMRVGAAAGLAGLLTLGAVAAPVSQAAHAKAPNWLSWNAKTKTATLTIIASYGGGFDFNGFQKGKLVYTVPSGSKVTVVYSNKSSIPHSVEFINFASTPPVTAPSPAFKGSASANYQAGVTSSVKAQTFSFSVPSVKKATNYLFICAVPGHAVAGMWDELVVSPSAKAASIKTSM